MLEPVSFKVEEEARKTRLVLCPKCDAEFKIAMEKYSAECEECGEEFEILEEGYPEEFVWHPSRSY